VMVRDKSRFAPWCCSDGAQLWLECECDIWGLFPVFWRPVERCGVVTVAWVQTSSQTTLDTCRVTICWKFIQPRIVTISQRISVDISRPSNKFNG
jgi:hypothetical protein